MSKAALGEVYGDLREHVSVLRYIPAERRNRMAGLVNALSDLCAMVSPDTGAAWECLSLLTLSGFTGLSRSMASDNELERAAEVIRTGGESGLDPFSRISTVKEAVQWGESFAVGADDVKRFFLQELKTYQMLQRVEGVGRIVHVAGRVLLVTGVALETIEMCTEINADLNDADGKIGVATGLAVGGFVGSMAGMAAPWLATTLVVGQG